MKWENVSLPKKLHVKDDKGWEEYQEPERPIPTSTWGQQRIETKKQKELTH